MIQTLNLFNSFCLISQNVKCKSSRICYEIVISYFLDLLIINFLRKCHLILTMFIFLTNATAMFLLFFLLPSLLINSLLSTVLQVCLSIVHFRVSLYKKYRENMTSFAFFAKVSHRSENLRLDKS